MSADLKYILISITSGSAAMICRQYQQTTGFEIWRQLHVRFMIPTGTRGIGYLTRLLKPTFDQHNFEESFTQWEYEVNRFETDNQSPLPDAVKVAILLNETKGSLQQHLQLQAGTNPTYTHIRTTIMEYYKSITAFSRMQQATSAQATYQRRRSRANGHRSNQQRKRKRLQRKEQQGQKQAEQGLQRQQGKRQWKLQQKEGSARAKERYRCNRKDGNNSRLDKAIHSARAMHKHHTKATKEKAKVSRPQQSATSAATQVTWPAIVERQCTTRGKRHMKIRHKHGGMTNSMTQHGGARTCDMFSSRSRNSS